MVALVVVGVAGQLSRVGPAAVLSHCPGWVQQLCNSRVVSNQ